MAELQNLLTREEALKLLQAKNALGKNPYIDEFNQKIAEWRQANPNKQFDLSQADLRWADMHEADLLKTDLINANLRKADLRGADLRGADLRVADLRGAYLAGAKYNLGENGTEFSPEFDPKTVGMILKTNAAEAKATKTSSPSTTKKPAQKAPANLSNLNTSDYAIAGVESAADIKNTDVAGVTENEKPNEYGEFSIDVNAKAALQPKGAKR